MADLLDEEELLPPPKPKEQAKATRQTPQREESVRYEAETRQEGIRPRTRIRKNPGQVDRLHIPKHLWPEDTDLQWVASTILGQPNTQGRAEFEMNGWSPVTPDMFGGRFDGVYHPHGYKGEITVGSLVLMERPMELTLEARAEEKLAAERAVAVHTAKLNGGRIDGMTMDTDHPSARRVTSVRRELLQVPARKD